MRHVRRLGGIALAAVIACGGCGHSGTPPASSSMEQAKVKGKVTRKGGPLSKVEVRFNAANVNRKSAAIVTTTSNDDGSYELVTLVGENSVTLGGPPATKDPAVGAFIMTVDLKAGDNTVDVTIP